MLTDLSSPHSASGRAYPDVAAQGSGFQVVVGGHVISVGGTSASCPVRYYLIKYYTKHDLKLVISRPSLVYLRC
jgi:tripeptidyl-peptidase-1